MGTRVYTVYFRNFPEESKEDELRNIFKKYGEITKIFVHHTKSYGMVEYKDLRSCHTAIENLHNKPPMNLFVSIAKNSAQKIEKRDSDEFSISSSTRLENNYTPNKRMISNNDDVYMYVDIYNKTIEEILFDETGRIYVPLDRVTGVRRIYKRKGNLNTEDYYKNPQNYIIEDLTPSNGIDSSSGDFSDLHISSVLNHNRRNRNQNQNQLRKNDKNHFKKSPNKSEENWNDRPDIPKPKPDSPRKPKTSRVKSELLSLTALRKLDIETELLSKKPERTPNIVLPPIKLPRNEYFEVFVMQSIDSNTAWVNATDEMDKMELISEKCIGKQFKKLTDVQIGDYCLTMLNDIWCRVKVIETHPKIKILFIDTGISEEVNLFDLHEIPSDICDIPPLAIKIKTKPGSPEITEENLRIKIIGTTPDGYKVVVATDDDIKSVDSPKGEKKIVNKMFSMLEVNTTGVLSPITFISNNTFVASFLPNSHLDELHLLAEMSLECQEDKSFSPQIGDLVVGEHAEGWCRGIFLGKEDTRFKIAFIDYGEEKYVEELRPVPDKYVNIPWFSCVCTVSIELARDIRSLAYYYAYDEIDDLNFKIKSLKSNGANILLMKQNDVLGDGQVEPWDPTDGLNSEENACSNDVVTELCSGDRIKIITETEEYLYIQTKYCENLLRKIVDLINKNIMTLPYVKYVPKIGQMVAALFEDKWYRAVVNNIDGDMATVLYVDYGNESELPWKKLKELNKNLKQIPYTVYKIKLKGYPGKFTENAIQHLNELCENNVVLTVNFDGCVEDGVELITKSGASIVDVLKKLDPPQKPVSITPKSSTSTPKKSLLQVLSKYQTKTVENKKQFKVPGRNDPKIMSNDYVLQEVPLGKQNIRILSLINPNIGLFSFCLNDEDVINDIHGSLSDDIQYYVENLSPYDPSYVPEVGEIILAKTDDTWKRALVSEIIDNDYYDVFLIDHGMTPTVNIKNIRRVSPDFIKSHAIASIALLNEVTTDDVHVKNIIEKAIVPGKIFDINIRSKDESDMYIVDIPQLSKEFQRL